MKRLIVILAICFAVAFAMRWFAQHVLGFSSFISFWMSMFTQMLVYALATWYYEHKEQKAKMLD